MLKKCASKFVTEILPSVTATVIGAYLVNHYINKPAAPPVAVVASTATPQTDGAAAPKAMETTSALEAGAAKAKAADKDKAPADKASLDKASDKEKSSDKAGGSPSPEKRWHQPLPRDKLAKAAPAAPVAAPVVPSPATTASVSPMPQPEPATAQEERRGANDLARAAIERLRASGDASRSADTAHGADAARDPEPARIVAAPPIQPSVQQIQPLPPAVTLTAPSVTTGEAYHPGSAAASPPVRSSDSGRMTPPADIPTPPIDVHADAGAPQRASVADDVVSAARSMFQAVVPR